MKRINPFTKEDIVYAQNKVAGADFSKVNHKDHNPNDNDCICEGCMEVLLKLAIEVGKRLLDE